MFGIWQSREERRATARKPRRCAFALGRSPSGLLFIWLLWAIVACVGCQRKAAAPAKQSQQSALRRADRSEALLKAAVAQLNDLPSAVDVRLRPPAVILDASKSADGNDVLAVASGNPAIPSSPVNLVYVPANNALFRRHGVKSGDIVKYYVLNDETVDEESRATGFTRRVALDLVVAQVIDEQTLMIEGALATAVPAPERLEIWRYVDDRLIEIYRQLRSYRDRRLPELGWEPSPDAKVLTQIVVWLNQWLRQSQPKTDWQVDPLRDSLPPELLSDELLFQHISNNVLSAKTFQPHEGRLLQEAVWHRDISRWARGHSFDNVERAAALFDWTNRNVQLDADDAARPYRPWHVLSYGHGTAEQRAWVFALLCRQLGLDVVVLALPPAETVGEGASTTPGVASFWLTALLEGGQLYLFDPRLGLPIPGPAGNGIATLHQVQQDDSLLRQLDLPNAAYPVTAEAARRVVAYVVADPFELSRRAKQVEIKLAGDDRLVLTVNPSALAAQLTALNQAGDVKLWDFPVRTLLAQLTLGGVPARNVDVLAFEPFAVRPVLWKARTRQFQGRRQVIESGSTPVDEDVLDDHAEAARLYSSPEVRPPERIIQQETSPEKRRVDTAAKLNAAYWLGLLSFDLGRLEVAAQWLGRPELQAAGSPWLPGTRYNLARTLEAQGKFVEAADLLEQGPSPQNHGNVLRARKLRSSAQQPLDNR